MTRKGWRLCNGWWVQTAFICELYKIKNKQMNIEFGCFTTSEQNHPSEQWGKLYMSIEISHMFLTWITVKWPRHDILINNTLVYIYLMLLGHECSVTCQVKVALVSPKVGLAGHFQPCIWRIAQVYVIVYFLQISEIQETWVACIWFMFDY